MNSLCSNIWLELKIIHSSIWYSPLFWFQATRIFPALLIAWQWTYLKLLWSLNFYISVWLKCSILVFWIDKIFTFHLLQISFTNILSWDYTIPSHSISKCSSSLSFITIMIHSPSCCSLSPYFLSIVIYWTT